MVFGLKKNMNNKVNASYSNKVPKRHDSHMTNQSFTPVDYNIVVQQNELHHTYKPPHSVKSLNFEQHSISNNHNSSQLQNPNLNIPSHNHNNNQNYNQPQINGNQGHPLNKKIKKNNQ